MKGTTKGYKITERVYVHANLLLENNLTVREIAKVTRFGKSTVHRDLHIVLRQFDMETYNLAKYNSKNTKIKRKR